MVQSDIMQRVLRSQADTFSFQHIKFAETMLRVGTPVLILIQVTFDTLRHQIRHFHPVSPLILKTKCIIGDQDDLVSLYLLAILTDQSDISKIVYSQHFQHCMC